MSKLTGRLVLTAICLLGATVACLLLFKIWPNMDIVPSVRAQGNESPNTKTIIANRPRQRDAIVVVKILGGGKEAVVGEFSEEDLSTLQNRPGNGRQDWRVAYRFQSDDNWLKTLSFVLRNRTSRKIVCVGIDITFPQGQGLAQFGPKLILFGWFPPIAPGPPPGEPNRPLGAKDPIDFESGQEMTFSPTDQTAHPRNRLGYLQPIPNITMCSIDFTAFFENGVAWNSLTWSYSKADPDDGRSLPMTKADFPGPFVGPPVPCTSARRRDCL
jgi:hypothetical protein